MKLAAIILSVAASLAFAGCARSGGNEEMQSGGAPGANSTAATAVPDTQSAPGNAPAGGARMQDASLPQQQQSEAGPVPPGTLRKIIRNAELAIEVDAPAEVARRVASLAESRGGFVVTSESRQQGGRDDVKPSEVVTVQVRVPAAEFDAVIGEILKVGGRVVEDKKTGQDVTEEYIDLEARIRTQRALEAQFLEIMKTANKVADALEVQRELAEVRTEIERLEGRRRFLENQTSLSTIKVTLRPPAPLVSTSSFFHGVRDAFGDGLDAAAAIVLVLIRVLIAFVPITLFVILPLALLVRFLLRRLRRRGAALT